MAFNRASPRSSEWRVQRCSSLAGAFRGRPTLCPGGEIERRRKNGCAAPRFHILIRRTYLNVLHCAVFVLGSHCQAAESGESAQPVDMAAEERSERGLQVTRGSPPRASTEPRRNLQKTSLSEVLCGPLMGRHSVQTPRCECCGKAPQRKMCWCGCRHPLSHETLSGRLVRFSRMHGFPHRTSERWRH